MATNPKPKRKTSKPKAKPRKTPVRRVNNQNTVRVHVINSIGGGAQPPPYTGPDRGFSFFIPEKTQTMIPRGNTGVSLSATPIMGKEIETQTDMIMDEPEVEMMEPILTQNRFDSLKVDDEKPLNQMTQKELRDLARFYKIKNYSRKNNSQLIQEIRNKGHES